VYKGLKTLSIMNIKRNIKVQSRRNTKVKGKGNPVTGAGGPIG
jgi:hypothetical protein